MKVNVDRHRKTHGSRKLYPPLKSDHKSWIYTASVTYFRQLSFQWPRDLQNFVKRWRHLCFPTVSTISSQLQAHFGFEKTRVTNVPAPSKFLFRKKIVIWDNGRQKLDNLLANWAPFRSGTVTRYNLYRERQRSISKRKFFVHSEISLIRSQFLIHEQILDSRPMCSKIQLDHEQGFLN